MKYLVLSLLMFSLNAEARLASFECSWAHRWWGPVLKPDRASEGSQVGTVVIDFPEALFTSGVSSTNLLSVLRESRVRIMSRAQVENKLRENGISIREGASDHSLIEQLDSIVGTKTTTILNEDGLPSLDIYRAYVSVVENSQAGFVNTGNGTYSLSVTISAPNSPIFGELTQILIPLAFNNTAEGRMILQTTEFNEAALEDYDGRRYSLEVTFSTPRK